MVLRVFCLYYSMGGAVAVHVAAKKSLPTLAGLVVVDVVEVVSLSNLLGYAFYFIMYWFPNISGYSNGIIDSYAEDTVEQNAAFLDPWKSGTQCLKLLPFLTAV